MWNLYIAVTVTISLTLGHVRIRFPPNRSSLWRDPAFKHYKPKINYDDDSLYCGRVLQKENDSRCGICGDPPTAKIPRPNENGGVYGKGIIAGRYTAGDVIPLKLEFTASHYGYFEVHICDELPETDTCFRKLKLENGNEKYMINPPQRPLWVNITAHLPPDIRCEQCTLRLHYRAGDSWGNCGNGWEDMGCGLQETFRSCSDIAIE